MISYLETRQLHLQLAIFEPELVLDAREFAHLLFQISLSSELSTHFVQLLLEIVNLNMLGLEHNVFALNELLELGAFGLFPRVEFLPVHDRSFIGRSLALSLLRTSYHSEDDELMLLIYGANRDKDESAPVRTSNTSGVRSRGAFQRA